MTKSCRMIASAFSKLNRNHFAGRDECVSQAHRRRPHGLAERGAARFDSRSSGLGGRPNMSRRTVRKRKKRMQRAMRDSALLKFETLVHLALRRGPACRIRPSNRGIASRCATIGACARPLSRYIPETKSYVPGDSIRCGGRSTRAMSGGITRGTLLALLDVPASGRHDATTMWGRPTRQEASRGNGNEDYKQWLDRRVPCAP